MDTEDNGTWYKCEKCGKKLIRRHASGRWHFMFGKCTDKEGGRYDTPPVDMEIVGHVKMRCLSRTCGHTNILNYYPWNSPFTQSSKEPATQSAPAGQNNPEEEHF